MDFQQLVYFRKVAELQHFTRAAEELAVSQPALSRAVARLEEELGLPLFEREGRSVRLNRHGRVFLGRVDRILQEVEAGRREMAELAGTEHGNVVLAFLHTLGARLVPDLIRTFRADHPGIGFQLSQDSTEVILGQLESGEVDLCLTTAIPRVHDAAFGWAELFSEQLYLVVPPEHALAGQGEVDLADVSGDDFISMKAETGLRQVSDELCRQAGFTPCILFESEEVVTIRGLVDAGLGVAMIPAPADPDALGPQWLRIRNPVCRRTIGMVWMEGRYLSGAGRMFRDFVRRRFEEQR